MFKPGEAIPLRLEIKNFSENPITVWSCGFWPNHRVSVTNELGMEPPLTEDGKTARKSFSPGGPRDKNFPMVLPPGAIYRVQDNLDLHLLYRLGTGRYRVRVLHHEPPLRVESNEVEFEIKASG